MESLFPFLIGKPYAAFVLTTFWSGICFFSGAYIGHRFALGRDTRKEFNAIADIVREKIRNHLRIIERGEPPNYLGNVSVKEFESLLDVTVERNRSALTEAWKAYEEAQQKCGDYEEGFYNFHSPEILRKALENLLPFVKRK